MDLFVAAVYNEHSDHAELNNLNGTSTAALRKQPSIAKAPAVPSRMPQLNSLIACSYLADFEHFEVSSDFPSCIYADSILCQCLDNYRPYIPHVRFWREISNLSIALHCEVALSAPAPSSEHQSTSQWRNSRRAAWYCHPLATWRRTCGHAASSFRFDLGFASFLILHFRFTFACSHGTIAVVLQRKQGGGTRRVLTSSLQSDNMGPSHLFSNSTPKFNLRV